MASRQRRNACVRRVDLTAIYDFTLTPQMISYPSFNFKRNRSVSGGLIAWMCGIDGMVMIRDALDSRFRGNDGWVNVMTVCWAECREIKPPKLQRYGNCQ